MKNEFSYIRTLETSTSFDRIEKFAAYGISVWEEFVMRVLIKAIKKNIHINRNVQTGGAQRTAGQLIVNG